MDLRVRIATRLKAARLEKGLTQEGLAREINMSHDIVSNVERGRTNPSLDLMATFCAALGLSLTDLFDGIDGIGGESHSREKHRYIFEVVTMLNGLPERECRRIRDLARVSIEG